MIVRKYRERKSRSAAHSKNAGVAGISKEQFRSEVLRSTGTNMGLHALVCPKIPLS
jgi:hypothetical protein